MVDMSFAISGCASTMIEGWAQATRFWLVGNKAKLLCFASHTDLVHHPSLQTPV